MLLNINNYLSKVGKKKFVLGEGKSVRGKRSLRYGANCAQEAPKRSRFKCGRMGEVHLKTKTERNKMTIKQEFRDELLFKYLTIYVGWYVNLEVKGMSKCDSNVFTLFPYTSIKMKVGHTSKPNGFLLVWKRTSVYVCRGGWLIKCVLIEGFHRWLIELSLQSVGDMVWNEI